MMKYISEFVPGKFYISCQIGYKDYTKILYGLRNLHILFIPLWANFSLILFINNIGFHKLLSAANMFWIPWQKDDKKKNSFKRFLKGKICHLSFGYSLIQWRLNCIFFFFATSICSNTYFHAFFAWTIPGDS